MRAPPYGTPFTCPCTVLNSTLDIYDMGEQERAGRYGHGFGLVSNCYSSEKDCFRCQGTGYQTREAPDRFKRIR